MCVEAAGVEIQDLVVNPIASAEAWTISNRTRRVELSLLILVAGLLILQFMVMGSIWHTSVIPVGGIQVTKDLSAGLGVPFNVAEELRLNTVACYRQAEEWTDVL